MHGSTKVDETHATNEALRDELAQIRAQAEGALVVSERRLRSLIERAADLLVVVDMNGIVRYIGPSITRLGGYEPGEVLGRNYAEFIHPQDLPAAAASFAQLIAHPEVPQATQFRFRHKTGGWLVLDSVSTNASADPAIGGVIVNARDITDRERARLDLAIKERYFRKLIEGGADAHFVIDAIGTVIYRSPTGQRLTGWDDDEVIGKSIAHHLTPDSRYLARVAIDEALQNPGMSTTVELRMHCKDGSTIDLEASGRNLLDDPDVAGIIVTARDITARKQAARTLTLFRALVDRSSDGVEVVEPGTMRFLDVNETRCTMLGYTRAELLALTVLDVDIALGPSALDTLKAALRDSGHAHWEGTSRRKDGSTFPTEVLIKQVDLDRPYYVVSVRDITERKAAAAALESRERYFRKLIESGTDGFYVIGQDGKALYRSPSVTQMTGWTEEEALEKTAVDFLVPEDRAKARGVIAAMFASPAGGTVLFEGRLRRKDGTVIDIETSGQNRLADPDVRGIVFSMRDVTARKRAADQLTLFRLLIDHARDAVIVVDPGTRRIIDVNLEVCRDLGFSRDELLARTLADIDPSSSDPTTTAKTDADLASTGAATFESMLHRKDGSSFPVEVRIRLIALDRPYIIAIARDITERRKTEQMLAKLNRVLRTLSAANEALMRAVTEPDLMSNMCRAIADVGGYRMAWIGRVQHDPDLSVTPIVFYGDDADLLRHVTVRCDEPADRAGAIQQAIESGQPQIRQQFDLAQPTQPWRDALAKHGVHAEAVFPLADAAGVFGTLSIYAAVENAFSSDEIGLLKEMANDLSYGISALRDRIARETFAARLRLSLESAVAALSATTESRDPYTAGHQHRVAELAVQIAREIGFSEDRIRGVFLAAIVHDVGKIQVPAELLAKPGRLSSVEFQLIQTHVQAGYDILKGIDFPWPVAEFVHQHHERLNGQGYPLGLTGDQIHLEARIIAVADVVEAMSSHRPYRPARSLDSAFAEIEAGKGVLYDPLVVDACLRLFKAKGFTFARDAIIPMRPPGSTPDLALEVRA